MSRTYDPPDTTPAMRSPSVEPAPASPVDRGLSWRTYVIGVVGGLLCLLLFVRVGQAFYLRLKPIELAEVPPTPVTVLEVVPTAFERTVPVSGSLAPVHAADLFPKVGGKVVAVFVNLGDTVKAGQAIAQLESIEYGLQARMAEAGAAMAEQAANVAERSTERLDRVQQKLGTGALSVQDDEAARLQAQGAATQRDVARIQSDLARQMVRNATLLSPIDGVITRVNGQVGSMIGQEIPAFHVDDLSSFVLRCEIGDLALPLVRPGQVVHLRTDARPGEALTGEVAAVAPSLDTWTRRAPIEISVPNPGGSIAGNLFARGEIVVGLDPGAIVLPGLVVERSLGDARVQLVRDGTVASVPVQVLAESHERVSVSGLKEGDLVVVPGAEHLASGEPARVARVISASALEEESASPPGETSSAQPAEGADVAQ
jgi:membrane fusion protein, multidrug efflux system